MAIAMNTFNQCGFILLAYEDPIIDPGMDPIKRQTKVKISRFPKKKYPRPAINATGIAWKVSVPTKTFGIILNGYKALRTNAPIAPAPIEVKPTNEPKRKPKKTVNLYCFLLKLSGKLFLSLLAIDCDSWEIPIKMPEIIKIVPINGNSSSESNKLNWFDINTINIAPGTLPAHNLFRTKKSILLFL